MFKWWRGKNLAAELDKAIDLSNGGKWNKALKIFDQLVKEHPDQIQLRFERAMVLLNLDRDSDAIEDLEFVLKSGPDYPGAKHWYAIALAAQGKPLAAAEKKLEELQALPPGHSSAGGQAWADCAGYFLAGGAAERALAALEIYFSRYDVKQPEQSSPAPLRVQAKALLALARPQEALAAAERACASPRSVPADMFVRICALATIGERDRAATEFGQLKPAFAGTLPFKETATELRRLGIPIE